jgi:tripartite-type tricarboxylate transporter receptor subunit TctC
VSLSFTGMVAPTGTPAAIVAKLNRAINEALTSSEIEAAFAKLGVEPHVGSAEDFSAFLVKERERWGAVVKGANIRVD